MYKVWRLRFLGREKVAELLIRNGANVNQKDHQGKTPLHLAAEQGNSVIQINILFISAWFLWLGHAKVIDLLRGNGADINIVDNRGKTAAESAAALTRKLRSY